METIEITVGLTDAEAWHYAQWLKRVSFSDYRDSAVSEDEAYIMRRAGERIREALAERGFAPR